MPSQRLGRQLKQVPHQEVLRSAGAPAVMSACALSVRPMVLGLCVNSIINVSRPPAGISLQVTALPTGPVETPPAAVIVPMVIRFDKVTSLFYKLIHVFIFKNKCFGRGTFV